MKRLLNYFREARAELGKVIWPTRQQAVKLTLAVMVFSLIFAAFIGGLDYLLSLFLQKVILRA
jgi:preprotein translocase subunit SecE